MCLFAFAAIPWGWLRYKWPAGPNAAGDENVYGQETTREPLDAFAEHD
jgi:hypothetical protein